MIMLSYKTRAMGFMGAVGDSTAKKLLAQLGEGLQLVLDALKNYSMAYEALGGQRDQIQLASNAVNNMQEMGAYDDQISL